MAFIASYELGEIGPRITSYVRGAVSSSNSVKEKSVAGPVSASAVLKLMEVILDARSFIIEWKGSPGLEQYYRDAYSLPNYDLDLELNNMLDKMTDLGMTIKSSLPISANGYLEVQTIQPNGDIVDRMIPTAGMTNIRIKIDAFLTTVVV